MPNPSSPSSARAPAVTVSFTNNPFRGPFKVSNSSPPPFVAPPRPHRQYESAAAARQDYFRQVDRVAEAKFAKVVNEALKHERTTGARSDDELKQDRIKRVRNFVQQGHVSRFGSPSGNMDERRALMKLFEDAIAPESVFFNGSRHQVRANLTQMLAADKENRDLRTSYPQIEQKAFRSTVKRLLEHHGNEAVVAVVQPGRGTGKREVNGDHLNELGKKQAWVSGLSDSQLSKVWGAVISDDAKGRMRHAAKQANRFNRQEQRVAAVANQHEKTHHDQHGQQLNRPVLPNPSWVQVNANA